MDDIRKLIKADTIPNPARTKLKMVLVAGDPCTWEADKIGWGGLRDQTPPFPRPCI